MLKGRGWLWRGGACLGALAAGVLFGGLVWTGTQPALAQPEAAMIVVNSAADTTGPDGLCTLREAIVNANQNSAVFTDCVAGAGADLINLNVVGTITLSAALPVITDSVEIGGVTAPATLISGNDRYRIFKIEGAVDAGFYNLTLQSGKVVSDVGGAIFNNGGRLRVDTVYFYVNRADSGGAIYSANATVMISNSTFGVNSATVVTGVGGALSLYGPSSTVTVVNSTFSNNLAPRAGGAIFTDHVSDLELINCTVTLNSVHPQGVGGGLASDQGLVTSTVMLRGDGAVMLKNSIVAGNSQGTTPGSVKGDCAGADILSAGYNLLGNGTGCSHTEVGDRFDNNPHLDILRINGGSTPTHAPRVGSLALDAIPVGVNGCGTAPLNVDQRRVPRPSDSNFDGVAACEIGAYEGGIVSAMIYLPLIFK